MCRMYISNGPNKSGGVFLNNGGACANILIFNISGAFI